MIYMLVSSLSGILKEEEAHKYKHFCSVVVRCDLRDVINNRCPRNQSSQKQANKTIQIFEKDSLACHRTYSILTALREDFAGARFRFSFPLQMSPQHVPHYPAQSSSGFVHGRHCRDFRKIPHNMRVIIGTMQVSSKARCDLCRRSCIRVGDQKGSTPKLLPDLCKRAVEYASRHARHDE